MCLKLTRYVSNIVTDTLWKNMFHLTCFGASVNTQLPFIETVCLELHEDHRSEAVST